MNVTVWGIRGGQERRLSAVRWQATSLEARALYFLSGATVLQMSESFDAILALQIRSFLDLFPNALLESTPAFWVLAVGPGLVYGRAAAVVSTVLGDAERGGGWGNKAFPDPTYLCQCGVDEVHNGEGSDALLRLYCCRPQPIKERCHVLGHTHGVGFCVHHMQRGHWH